MAITWVGNKRIEIPEGATPEWELQTKENQAKKKLPAPKAEPAGESNIEKDE